ncbi:Oxidoreductase-like domain-containing protein 1 [Madurella mycetomatis]|uniref:Oxidoreductase-like domain-containing protein 1 n=1 Tax=Madurella mycetomatis TaxID=100816 RepID=A0A175VSB1_9PEZI|nr:Oxidoreductase-like domain-containing protein 1 [Madurella mycetomatis]
MRRGVFSALPARAVYLSFGTQQPRRTFATLPTKDNTPPSPIEPSKEQAHPIGPFYESILRSSLPIPEKKPEVPPVTSQEHPAKAAAEEATKPAPAQQKASKPAAGDKTSKPPSAAEAPEAEEKAAATTKSAPRRTRKPKVAAKDDTTTTTTKAKSVPSSSSSSFSSSHSPDPSEPPPQEDTPSNDVQARARVVFGSSLAGPAERAERLARIRSESRLVAGVLVPPRPEEPDNCCMSGCVNCVWDRYRDELEDWADKNAEAERRLRARDAGDEVRVTGESMTAGEGTVGEMGSHERGEDRGAVSMDDDGGGSVGNWVPSDAAGGDRTITKDFWDEELYKNVPVGIREFMKHEKKLKEKHRREGTVGG